MVEALAGENGNEYDTYIRYTYNNKTKSMPPAFQRVKMAERESFGNYIYYEEYESINKTVIQVILMAN